MSNVTLEISGRRYTVACAAGEESHIAKLGASINARLAELPDMRGQSEPRTLLYAALLLADELHEANQMPASDGGDLAGPLEQLAERLETLASRLETGAASA